MWSGTFPREAFEGPGDVQPRPHDNCYWLLPGRFLAGEYPGQVDPQRQVARLTALFEAGVRQVLDLSELPAGLYVVRVINGTGSASRRLVLR